MSSLDNFLRDPKALIIAPQWAQLIARGEKTWELRSQAVKHRGYFAIAEKGTGRLIAMANLRECRGPHSINYLREHLHRHRGAEEVIVAPGFKYTFSWELDNVQRFNCPVDYQPKSGAVSWVKLSTDVVEKIVEEMKVSPVLSEVIKIKSALDSENTLKQRSSTVVDDQEPPIRQQTTGVSEMPRIPESGKLTVTVSWPKNNLTELRVPKAKDGTMFDRKSCLRNGNYRVGERGNEKTFKDYLEALNYLKQMKTAVWRRPTPNGNWGGVRAVEWVTVLG